MLLLIVILIAFPIWMIVDCIKNESDEKNNKLIWLLVIMLAPCGSLIYFFARKLPRPS